MVTAAILALAVGLLSAFRLSLVRFMAALLVATVLGLAVGLAVLPGPLDVLTGGLLLFASTQVGYGLGLAVASIGQSRGDGST